MESKSFTGVEIKDANQGLVSASFATFNMKDSDGDVTLPGAFEEGAQVKISAYGHSSWGPSRGSSSVPMLPVGKGVIRTTDREAILDGQFFLATTAGRDTFEVVKQMGDLQEWSYGFTTLQASKGEHDGEKVQFLEKQQVFEVSPVLAGAGQTRTLAVKAAYGYQPAPYDATMEADETIQCTKCGLMNDSDARFCDQCGSPLASGRAVGYTPMPDETVKCPECGLMNETDAKFCDQCGTQFQGRDDMAKARSFADEAEHALGSVQALTIRAQALGSLRAGTKEGRTLSAATRNRLSSLHTAMTESMAEVEQLLAESDPMKHRNALINEAARYERLRAAL